MKKLLLILPLFCGACDYKKGENNLIRIETPIIVDGSVWTNNTWVYVGRVLIPTNYIVGPFEVK